MKIRMYLTAAALLCVAVSVFAQENALDLLKQHAYPVKLENGKLSGKGAGFILQETEGVQFVVLGEQHNNREIPQLTSALFSLLNERRGFKFLALEQDPLTCRLISGSPLVGNEENIVGYARENPNSFTFITDQELEMIARAGRISDAHSNRIWGLDQVFGPIHGLQQLLPKLSADKDKGAVLEMVSKLKALQAAKSAKFERYTIADAMEEQGFVELLQQLKAQKDPTARFIVSQMLISADIYRKNISAGKGQLTGLASNVEREENMKRLMLLEYRNAVKKGERLPRVLFKFGHYHAIRGRGWSNIYTLGNFVSEFAKSNDRESFHIAVYINNSEGDYSVLSSYPDYRPLAAASPEEQWTVLDLRPLRKYIHAGKLEGGNPELTRIAFGFDAALIIGGGKPGTYDLFTQ